jgi:hypothetical protein
MCRDDAVIIGGTQQLFPSLGRGHALKGPCSSRYVEGKARTALRTEIGMRSSGGRWASVWIGRFQGCRGV